MRIYADTNIYARPFDDYSQPRIFLEGETALLIFRNVAQRKFSIITSDILFFEIAHSPSPKRIQIEPFLQLSNRHISQSQQVFDLAKSISHQCRVAPRDAMHLASAKLGAVNYVLTCDDKVLNKFLCLKQHFSLQVINPVQFLTLINL